MGLLSGKDFDNKKTEDNFLKIYPSCDRLRIIFSYLKIILNRDKKRSFPDINSSLPYLSYLPTYIFLGFIFNDGKEEMCDCSIPDSFIVATYLMLLGTEVFSTWILLPKSWNSVLIWILNPTRMILRYNVSLNFRTFSTTKFYSFEKFLLDLLIS